MHLKRALDHSLTYAFSHIRHRSNRHTFHYHGVMACFVYENRTITTLTCNALPTLSHRAGVFHEICLSLGVEKEQICSVPIYSVVY